MTLPNGVDGIADAIGTVFATTGDRSHLSGWGTNFISGMTNLTQDSVTELLKANVIHTSAAWNGAADNVFGGLARGNPIIGAISLPAAIIEGIISRLFGVDVTDFSMDNLLAQIEQVPLVGDLISMAQAIGTGLSTTINPTTVQTAIGDVESAVKDFFTRSVVDLLDPSRLPVLPIGHIGLTNPDLLINGSFDAPESLDPTGAYIWDGDVDHTGRIGSGSAKVIGNGTDKSLSSNSIGVTGKQQLSIGGYLKWTAITGSGSLFQIAVVPYLGTVAGTATIIAQVSNPAANSDWTHLSGTYTVPDTGVDSVRVRITTTAAITAGTAWWDDLSTTKIGLIPGDFLSGIGGTVRDDLQGIADAVRNAIAGPGDSGGQVIAATIDDIETYLSMIPPINIQGVGGANSILDTFENTWNQLWGGFARTVGAGKSIADVANGATDVSNSADTAVQIGEWNNAILNIRNNKSIMSGIDETEESNFLISDLYTGAADPPTISATASAVPIGFWRATETAKKGSVSWFGKGITNVTSLFIDIYKFDYTTNTMRLVHTSTDQIGQATASWRYMVYNIPTASRITVNAGDVLGIAFRVVGTGTHSIAGKSAPWITGHPTAIPSQAAAVRTGSGNQLFSAITYSGNVPWFGLGIVSGDAPPDYYAPRSTEFTTPGAFSYSIPAWANYVDVIMIGGGGGGAGGNPIAPINGVGGNAGTWVGETLVRGVDFPTTATTVTGTVGSPGPKGPWSSAAGDGTASQRDAITSGKAAAVAAGGVGGKTMVTAESQGKPAGNFTWNGTTYIGGNGGTSGSARNGTDGQAPGAGGGGGGGGTYGVAWDGGYGARGGVWIVARQS